LIACVGIVIVHKLHSFSGIDMREFVFGLSLNRFLMKMVKMNPPFSFINSVTQKALESKQLRKGEM
jgi:hypothetical protein